MVISLGLTGWAIHLQKKARAEEERAKIQEGQAQLHRAEAEKASQKAIELALEQQVLKAQQMFVSDQGAEGMSILAGVLRQSLVLCLPGSVKGATQSLQAVLELLPHIMDLLSGQIGHTSEPSNNNWRS